MDRWKSKSDRKMKMNKRFTRKTAWLAFMVLAAVLTACAAPGAGGTPTAGSSPGALKVRTTTDIVADVVRQVGGEYVNVDSLMSPGQDPHNFEPTPQDIAKVSDANLLFINGAGLEAGFIDRLISNAGVQDRTVSVSQGIQLLSPPGAGQAGTAETGGDPHTWTDPNNVKAWVDNIVYALEQVDRTHAVAYENNGAQYKAQLDTLDQWIRTQVQAIPQDHRQIVSDHEFFTYFAHEYGFEMVGALIPGYSSDAQPSARDLANLEDAIKKYGVDAIFVGVSSNPTLANQVAQDTGAKVVRIYTGELSAPGQGAGTYIEYMHYDVNQIVQALAPGSRPPAQSGATTTP